MPFVARLSFLLLLKGIYVNARSDKQQTAKQQQENNNRSEYYNGITAGGVHVCVCVFVYVSVGAGEIGSTDLAPKHYSAVSVNWHGTHSLISGAYPPFWWPTRGRQKNEH